MASMASMAKARHMVSHTTRSQLGPGIMTCYKYVLSLALGHIYIYIHIYIYVCAQLYALDVLMCFHMFYVLSLGFSSCLYGL